MKKNNYYSLIFVFMLTQSAVLMMFNHVFKIDNALPYLMIFMVFVLLTVDRVIIQRQSFILIIIPTITLLFTILFRYNVYAVHHLFEFLSFGIIGILLANKQIFTKTYNISVIAVSFFWIVFNLWIFPDFRITEGFLFGYSTLPLFYSLVLVKYNNKNMNYFVNTLVLVMLSINAFHILLYAGRGAVLNVILFLTIISLKYLNRVETKRKTIVILVTLAIIFISFVINDNFLTIIYRFNPTVFSFIDKTVYLINNSDISNGRFELYTRAISQISHSTLLFGNGIGSFEVYNIGTYSHNIFVDILFDFGLIGVIFFSYMLALYGRKIHNEKINSDLILNIIVFHLSVVILLFSSTYWSSFAFFYWIGLNVKVKRGSYDKK